MTFVNLDSIFESTKNVVVQVGSYVQKSFGTNFKTYYKDVKDPQTDIDILAENMLVEKLSRLLPSADLMLEEGKDKNTGAEYCWVIDAIDGTKFFSTQCPIFFIQVALTYKTEVVLGVIYHPLTHQLFSSIDGGGAYLNASKVTVSQEVELSSCIVAVELGEFRPQDTLKKQYINSMLPVFKRTWVISGGLGPYLLTRTVDAYIRCYESEPKDKWNDVAPRIILFREAGARIEYISYKGEKGQILLAANPTLFEKISRLLTS